MPLPGHPEGVPWSEQHTQAMPLAQSEQIIPQAHHDRVEASGRSLEVISIGVCVLKHQAQDSDAVCGEVSEVSFDACHIAALESGKPLPLYGIVNTDEEERFVVGGFGVPPAGCDVDR